MPANLTENLKLTNDINLIQIIKAYESIYFLGRDEAGSKWPPVHKIKEQLHDNHSRVMKATFRHNPNLLYYESYYQSSATTFQG